MTCSSPRRSCSNASWKTRSPTSTASSTIHRPVPSRAIPTPSAKANRSAAICLLCARQNSCTTGFVRPLHFFSSLAGCWWFFVWLVRFVVFSFVCPASPPNHHKGGPLVVNREEGSHRCAHDRPHGENFQPADRRGHRVVHLGGVPLHERQ